MVNDLNSTSTIDKVNKTLRSKTHLINTDGYNSSVFYSKSQYLKQKLNIVKQPSTSFNEMLNSDSKYKFGYKIFTCDVKDKTLNPLGNVALLQSRASLMDGSLTGMKTAAPQNSSLEKNPHTRGINFSFSFLLPRVRGSYFSIIPMLVWFLIIQLAVKMSLNPPSTWHGSGVLPLHPLNTATRVVAYKWFSNLSNIILYYYI